MIKVLKIFALFLGISMPASAGDIALLPPGQPGVTSVTVSYMLNVPPTAFGPDAVAEQDRSYRKALYRRGMGECADLLDSIAASCVVTDIRASTQLNEYPGQAATLFVSGNVTMEIELKDEFAP